jgi:hypothetical protein
VSDGTLTHGCPATTAEFQKEAGSNKLFFGTFLEHREQRSMRSAAT